MFNIQPLGGPQRGFKLSRQRVYLKAHDALTAGVAYPVSLTDVGANYEWYLTADADVVSENGSIHVVPEANMAADDYGWFTICGTIDAVAGEAISAAGVPLTLDATGEFIDTVTVSDRIVGFALEAAADGATFKVAFVGGGSFGQDVGT